MSTFLGTTALDEFWDRDAEDILFLGSWCLRHDRRERWVNLSYRLLPCPWDDRERFADAAVYVDQVGERLLLSLVEYLNGVHRERRSARYWRILLGPWLMQSIHALYDRFEHLRDAATLGAFTTVGLDAAYYRVPATSNEQLLWLGEDLYNLQLFTQMLEALGHHVSRRRPALLNPRESPEPLLGRVRRLAARAFETTLRQSVRLIRRRGSISLQDMYADRSQRLSLAFRSAGTVIPVQSAMRQLRAKAVFDERRSRLAQLPGENEFERTVITLLPHLFPVAYLEGYRELRGGDGPVPAAGVFASANGWHLHESTKFLAAETSERGAKLVAIQHGGGYGVYRHAPVETHEKRIADRFLVWGWASQDPAKLRNAPAANLSSISRNLDARPDTNRFLDILFLATSHPRYLFRFHSAPVGSQWGGYFDWQTRFFRSVRANITDRLVYRGYLYDYGQAVNYRLASVFQTIRRDSSGAGTAALLRSRIVVIDHCATAYLEALALNIPTILFWNHDQWEIRADARPYFDALRDCKILFSTPEEAAEHLSAVYERPQTWWWSDDVQNARSRFVSVFAMIERDWEQAWTDALLDEATPAAQVPVLQA